MQSMGLGGSDAATGYTHSVTERDNAAGSPKQGKTQVATASPATTICTQADMDACPGQSIYQRSARVTDFSANTNKVCFSGQDISPAAMETSACLPPETMEDIRRKAMQFYFKQLAVVDSPELFKYLYQCQMAGFSDLVSRCDPAMLEKVLTPELVKDGRYIHVPDLPKEWISRDFALACVEANVGSFPELYEQFSDSGFFLECLQRQVRVIEYLPGGMPDIDYGPLMKNYFPGPDKFLLLKYIPESCRTPGLCRLSVVKQPESLASVPETLHDYENICLAALKKNGSVLRHVPEDKVTEEMVELAVRSSNPPDIMEIPAGYRTEENCLRVLESRKYTALEGVPEGFYYDNPAFFDKAIEHVSWSNNAPDALKTAERYGKNFAACVQNISHLPEDILLGHYDWCLKACSEDGELAFHVPLCLRNEELCLAAVKNSPVAIKFVPASIMADRPDILSLAASHGFLPAWWPNDEVDIDLCKMAVAQRADSVNSIPRDVLPLMPQELLLAYAPGHLSDKNKEQLINTGDTYFLPHAKVTATAEALLQAYPPCLHKNSGTAPALRSQLLNSRPFSLRNQEAVGKSLNDYVESHYQVRNHQLSGGMLPVVEEIPDNCEVYGGRTALWENGSNCTRVKFLRSNEALADFLREEAVHQFIDKDPSALPLKSEVPVPDGLFLIRCDDMPEALVKAFKSSLKKVTVNNVDYFLGYQFSTRNRDYSKLAHRPDPEGGYHKAEQGLLNACFDLGLWSSAGIVHTSTMMIYHNLGANRRYLFLAPLFDKALLFPGAMYTLNNDAINETDWSWTGLKDLGDFESYPGITSYLSGKDSRLQVPGYGQRCSFLNAFCENMVAALLHYAQLHRDDAGYHYNNQPGMERLATFTESAISHFLHGLFGTEIALQTLFQTPGLYRDWLNLAVREFAYWTEKQSPGKDCMASDINAGKFAEGLYCAELPAGMKFRYPDHFIPLDMEVMGLSQGEFPAVRLANGLFVVAGAIAERLQPQVVDVDSQME